MPHQVRAISRKVAARLAAYSPADIEVERVFDRYAGRFRPKHSTSRPRCEPWPRLPAEPLQGTLGLGSSSNVGRVRMGPEFLGNTDERSNVCAVFANVCGLAHFAGQLCLRDPPHSREEVRFAAPSHFYVMVYRKFVRFKFSAICKKI